MLKKLKLDLDALAVESFATDRGAAARGTVRAHTAAPACHYVETENAPTCVAASCNCVASWGCGTRGSGSGVSGTDAFWTCDQEPITA